MWPHVGMIFQVLALVHYLTKPSGLVTGVLRQHSFRQELYKMSLLREHRKRY